MPSQGTVWPHGSRDGQTTLGLLIPVYYPGTLYITPRVLYMDSQETLRGNQDYFPPIPEKEMEAFLKTTPLVRNPAGI